MYGKRKGGGRFLTETGKAYKNNGSRDLGLLWADEEPLDPGVLYKVEFVFFLPWTKFYNATFGKSGGPKSRYKKIDLTGFVKAPEDVLSDVTGVDDSHFKPVMLDKEAVVGEGWTEVTMWRLDNIQEGISLEEARMS